MPSPPSTPIRRNSPPPTLSEETTPTPKKIRRFVPQPVETSTRTNRKPPRSDDDPPAEHSNEDTRADASPHGSTPPKARDSVIMDDPRPPRRRFAPEPVETSTRSNRKPVESLSRPEVTGDRLPSRSATDQPRPSGRRKFAPQLLETTRRSRRSGDTLPAVLESDKTHVSPGDLDSNTVAHRPQPTPVPTNTPLTSSNSVHQINNPIPHSGPLRKSNPTRYSSRQHSFRVPDLPKIDSSESEASDARSHSSSLREDSQTSDEGLRDAARMRESQDEIFSGYLLRLAASAAEKQLREQAAAAFPNSDYHEPVAHYMDVSGSEHDLGEVVAADGRGQEAKQQRRDSEDANWALKAMQKHGEEKLKDQPVKPNQRGIKIEGSDWIPPTANIPFLERSKPGQQQQAPKGVIGGHQRDAGLKQMRKAASPPMLGGSIDFPRCASPDNARFDVTQGADYLKQAMSATEQARDDCGLWIQPGDAAPSKPATTAGICGGGTWGCNGTGATTSTGPANGTGARGNTTSSRPATPNNGLAGGVGGGLWGGFCTEMDRQSATPVGLVTPIRTPVNERDDPFNSISITKTIDSTAIAPSRRPTGPQPNNQLHSPPNSYDQKRSLHQPQHSLSGMNARLEIEAQIDAEFSDVFVTQVYNYLSIGYPSIGKKYDDELSKIARMPVEHLRQDDKLAEARGYVRLGTNEVDIYAEDVGLDSDVIIHEEMCMRWKALRSYVREWGRQMIKREREGGNSSRLDPHRAWGLTARKGSWGL